MKFKILSATALLLILSFTFIACDGGTEAPTAAPDTQQQTSESPTEGLSEEASFENQGTESPSESQEPESPSDENPSDERPTEAPSSEDTDELPTEHIHTPVTDSPVAPTCTETGLTEGSHCSVCGEVIIHQSLIPSQGHELVYFVGKSATCTESGHDSYEECKRCEYTTFATTDALGHSLSYREGLDPTCVEDGYTAYEFCNRCDHTTITVLPATGHTLTYYPEMPPTCLTDGAAAYEACVLCGYTTYEVLSATGHSLNFYSEKSPSCTEDGHCKYEACEMCEYTTYESIPAAGHTLLTCPEMLPTCEESGWHDYLYCTVCDYTTMETLPATGHDYTLGYDDYTHFNACRSCQKVTDQAEHTYDINGLCFCAYNCVHVVGTTASCSSQAICAKCRNPFGDPLPHTPVTVVGNSPSCTESGLSDGSICVVCESILTEQKTIPPTGHSLEYFNAKEVTCTEDGWDAYEDCTACEYTTFSLIVATGHNTVVHEKLEPTCTEAGYDRYMTCTRCDYSTYFELPALGHSYSHHAPQSPSCENVGWNEYFTCTRCTYSEYEEIPVLGHELTTYTGKAPDCENIGWNEYEACNRCDYSTYNELPSTGHSTGELIPEVAPTCTSDGTEAHFVCSLCSKCFTAGGLPTTWESLTTAKDPYAHNIILHNASAPTCISVGWNAYESCSLCSYSTYFEIAALGHDFSGEWVTDTPATESEVGERSKHCLTCGERGEISEIPMLPYSDGLEYTLIGGEYHVTGLGIFDGSALNIPPTHKGLPITHISLSGQSCTAVSSMSIPDSVTGIDRGSFMGFASLTSVDIPFLGESLEASDSGTTDFSDVYPYTVTDIVLRGGATIYAAAFENAYNLNSLSIPPSVTKICRNAFLYAETINHVYISDISAWCNIEFEAEDSNPLFFADNLYLNGELVTEITIPEGVTSIGNYAFEHSNITSISLPSTLISIGAHAFDASTLQSIDIPDEVTSIGEYAFKNCSVMSEATLSSSLEGIGKGAFYGCSALGSVSFPSTLSTVDDDAFYGCSALSEIILPESLISVGQYSFYGCSTAAKLYMPQSVASVGFNAFGDCTSLRDIYISDLAAWCEKQTITTGGIFILDHAENLYLNGERIVDLVIPEGVTVIGGGAFTHISSIESVSFPSTLEYINHSAFEDCTGLTSISIPSNVKFIYKQAFKDCSNLSELTIANGVEGIGVETFYGCSSLESIAIPPSITEIQTGAFSGCTGLTGVYITDLVAWNNIEFGPSYTLYYSNPLTYAHDLYLNGELITTLTLPEGTTKVGAWAYCHSSIEKVILPSSVTEIGEWTFYNCASLTSVQFPDGVKAIQTSAFADCTSLVSAPLPSALEEIHETAFAGCVLLDGITLPDTITFIGERAFQNCYNVFTVENGIHYVGKWIVDADTSIESIIWRNDTVGIASYAFSVCEKLTEVTIPNSITMMGTHVFSFCYGLTDVSLGTGIDSIPRETFNRCTSLKNVYIPNNITSIGICAFFKSGIESINIPSSVLKIERNAFEECTALVEITIPDSVRSIEREAFMNCTALERVVLGDGVESIGESAFRYNEKLSEVVFGTGLKNIDQYAFYGCTSLIQEENGIEYVNNWAINATSRFMFFTSLREGTVGIAAMTFNNRDMGGSIVIPDSVIYIGYRAFYACKDLGTITLHGQIELIGQEAFDVDGEVEIVFSEENPNYYLDGGLLIESATGNVIFGGEEQL